MMNGLARAIYSSLILALLMSGLLGCPPKKEAEGHKPGDGHDHDKEEKEKEKKK